MKYKIISATLKKLINTIFIMISTKLLTHVSSEFADFLFQIIMVNILFHNDLKPI